MEDVKVKVYAPSCESEALPEGTCSTSGAKHIAIRVAFRGNGIASPSAGRDQDANDVVVFEFGSPSAPQRSSKNEGVKTQTWSCPCLNNS